MGSGQAKLTKVATRAQELMDLLMQTQEEYEVELQRHIFDHSEGAIASTSPSSAQAPEGRLHAKLTTDFLGEGGRFTARLHASLVQFMHAHHVMIPPNELEEIIRRCVVEQVRRYQARVMTEAQRADALANKEEALQRELASTWNTLEF